MPPHLVYGMDEKEVFDTLSNHFSFSKKGLEVGSDAYKMHVISSIISQKKSIDALTDQNIDGFLQSALDLESQDSSFQQWKDFFSERPLSREAAAQDTSSLMRGWVERVLGGLSTEPDMNCLKEWTHNMVFSHTFGSFFIEASNIYNPILRRMGVLQSEASGWKALIPWKTLVEDIPGLSEFKVPGNFTNFLKLISIACENQERRTEHWIKEIKFARTQLTHLEEKFPHESMKFFFQDTSAAKIMIDDIEKVRISLQDMFAHPAMKKILESLQSNYIMTTHDTLNLLPEYKSYVARKWRYNKASLLSIIDFQPLPLEQAWEYVDDLLRGKVREIVPPFISTLGLIEQWMWLLKNESFCSATKEALSNHVIGLKETLFSKERILSPPISVRVLRIGSSIGRKVGIKDLCTEFLARIEKSTESLVSEKKWVEQTLYDVSNTWLTQFTEIFNSQWGSSTFSEIDPMPLISRVYTPCLEMLLAASRASAQKILVGAEEKSSPHSKSKKTTEIHHEPAQIQRKDAGTDEKLQADLAVSQKKSEELMRKLDEVSKNETILKEALARKIQEFELSASNLESSKKLCKEEEAAHKRAREELVALRKKVDRDRISTRTLQETSDKESKEKQAQLDQKEQELKGLSSQLDNLKKDHQISLKKCEETERVVEGKEKEFQSIAQKLKEKEALLVAEKEEILKISLQLSEFRANHQTIERRLQDAQSVLEEKTKGHTAVTMQLKSSEETIQKKAAEITALSQQLEGLRKESKEHQAIAAQLQETRKVLGAKEAEASQLSRQLEDMVAKHRDVVEELDQLKEELAQEEGPALQDQGEGQDQEVEPRFQEQDDGTGWVDSAISNIAQQVALLQNQFAHSQAHRDAQFSHQAQALASVVGTLRSFCAQQSRASSCALVQPVLVAPLGGYPSMQRAIPPLGVMQPPAPYSVMPRPQPVLQQFHPQMVSDAQLRAPIQPPKVHFIDRTHIADLIENGKKTKNINFYLQAIEILERVKTLEEQDYELKTRALMGVAECTKKKQKWYVSALDAAQHTMRADLQAEVLIKFGGFYYKVGDIASAKDQYLKALDFLIKIDNPDLKVEALIGLMDANQDQAEYFYERALSVAREKERKDLEAQAHIRFGMSMIAKPANISKAKECIYSALKIEGLPVTQKGEALIRFVHICINYKNIEEASDCMKSLLELDLDGSFNEKKRELQEKLRLAQQDETREKGKDKDVPLGSHEKAVDLISKGERLRTSEAPYREVIKLLESHEDARACELKAHAWLRLGNIHESIKYHETALMFAEKANAPWIHVQSLIGLGQAKSSQKKNGEAIACYEKALKLNPEGLSKAHIFIGLANAYFYLSEFSRAQKYIDDFNGLTGMPGDITQKGRKLAMKISASLRKA